MSVLNRLFGGSSSSGSARKPGLGNARLGLESLELREVPAIVFVGGWGSSMYQYAYEGASSRADGVPTDQFALNFTKIEFNQSPAAPASDYLLTLDGVKGESRAAGDPRDQIHVESFSWGCSSPASSTASTPDDVVVDGQIITGENYDSDGIATHGYIRIKKLNSGG
jgi:hypothetical protein